MEIFVQIAFVYLVAGTLYIMIGDKYEDSKGTLIILLILCWIVVLIDKILKKIKKC